MAQAQAAPAGSGEQLDVAQCAACHQANGQGLAGAFPPLAESDYFATDVMKVLEATALGLSGPVTVNGEEYNNVMPAMSYINDQDLAAILKIEASNDFPRY